MQSCHNQLKHFWATIILQCYYLYKNCVTAEKKTILENLFYRYYNDNSTFFFTLSRLFI